MFYYKTSISDRINIDRTISILSGYDGNEFFQSVYSTGILNSQFYIINYQLKYGDVKVSTGILNLGKRVAVWNRYKIHNFLK